MPLFLHSVGGGWLLWLVGWRKGDFGVQHSSMGGPLSWHYVLGHRPCDTKWLLFHRCFCFDRVLYAL